MHRMEPVQSSGVVGVVEWVLLCVWLSASSLDERAGECMTGTHWHPSGHPFLTLGALVRSLVGKSRRAGCAPSDMANTAVSHPSAQLQC